MVQQMDSKKKQDQGESIEMSENIDDEDVSYNSKPPEQFLASEYSRSRR